MATPTYELIETTTLTSSASSVSFSSITQDYRDLVVVIEAKPTGVANLHTNFNSDTGSNYNGVRMVGDINSPGAGSDTNATFHNSGRAGFNLIHMMDYSATDKHKTSLARANDSGLFNVIQSALRYASTSAITSIEFTLSGNQFDTGATFSIYGIAS